jgi:hypothetical protein
LKICLHILWCILIIRYIIVHEISTLAVCGRDDEMDHGSMEWEIFMYIWLSWEKTFIFIVLEWLYIQKIPHVPVQKKLHWSCFTRIQHCFCWWEPFNYRWNIGFHIFYGVDFYMYVWVQHYQFIYPYVHVDLLSPFLIHAFISSFFYQNGWKLSN